MVALKYFLYFKLRAVVTNKNGMHPWFWNYLILFENRKSYRSLLTKVMKMLLPFTQSLYTLNFKIINWFWNCFSSDKLQRLLSMWIGISVGTGSKKELSRVFGQKCFLSLFVLFWFFFKFCNSANLNLQPWRNVPSNCASIQSPFQLLI